MNGAFRQKRKALSDSTNCTTVSNEEPAELQMINFCVWTDNSETGKWIVKNVLGKTRAEVRGKLKVAVEQAQQVGIH